jgi:predicted phosphohydrolase
MKLYRYEKECHQETLRDWDDNSNVKVALREYNVYRHTPKGYVIKHGMKDKWISSTGKKRFAYPEKLDAMNNFIARTYRSIGIMNHYTDYSELALEEAEKIKLTL